MTNTRPPYDQQKLMFAILNLSASVDTKTKRLIELAEESKKVADALSFDKQELQRCAAQAETMAADVSI